MTIEQFIYEVMIPNGLQVCVWDWASCPLSDKHICNHEGMEDFVILGKNNEISTHYVINDLKMSDEYSVIVPTLDHGEYLFCVTKM